MLFKRKTIANLAVSMMLMMPYELKALGSGYHMQPLANLYVLVMLLVSLCCMPRTRRCLAVMLVAALSFCTLYLASSFDIVGDYSSSNLVAYVLCPVALGQINRGDISAERVCRHMTTLSLVGVPVIGVFLEYRYASIQQMDMGYAYTIFVSVSAALLHFAYYRRNADVITKAGYAFNLYLLASLLAQGNRGVFLCLACLLLMVQTQKAEGSFDNPGKRLRWRLLILAEAVAAVAVYAFADDVSLALYDFFNARLGFVPSFLLKIRQLSSMNVGFGNGRDSVYGLAIRLIAENPLGYGIDSFIRFEGRHLYPHNFALQLLLDCGWVFGGLLLAISLLPLAHLLRDGNRFGVGYWVLMTLVVSITFPKLMLSGDIWLQPQFWYVLGLGVSDLLDDMGSLAVSGHGEGRVWAASRAS